MKFDAFERDGWPYLVPERKGGEKQPVGGKERGKNHYRRTIIVIRILTRSENFFEFCSSTTYNILLPINQFIAKKKYNALFSFYALNSASEVHPKRLLFLTGLHAQSVSLIHVFRKRGLPTFFGMQNMKTQFLFLNWEISTHAWTLNNNATRL